MYSIIGRNKMHGINCSWGSNDKIISLRDWNCNFNFELYLGKRIVGNIFGIKKEEEKRREDSNHGCL